MFVAETSAAVATEALNCQPDDPFALLVVIASGQNFPDGLAAAALAACTGGSVLLVPGTADLGAVPDVLAKRVPSWER